jgi:hypothetical protein
MMSQPSEDLATMAEAVTEARERAKSGVGYDDAEVAALIAVVGLIARKVQRLEHRAEYWRRQVAAPLPPGVTDMLVRRVAGGGR